jgi:hypothetical protein
MHSKCYKGRYRLDLLGLDERMKLRIILQNSVCECVNLIRLAQDRGQQRALLKTIRNREVS